METTYRVFYLARRIVNLDPTTSSVWLVVPEQVALVATLIEGYENAVPRLAIAETILP